MAARRVAALLLRFRNSLDGTSVGTSAAGTAGWRLQQRAAWEYRPWTC
jgi:hypothetical protein